MCLRLHAFFMPKVSSSGAGYAQTIVNSWFWNTFMVWKFGVFFVSGIVLGVIFVDFGGLWTTFW